MANSPSSLTARRNRPGCMGGIAHLFDFNQALAGRKLLTDKKFGAGVLPGLEPLRTSLNDNEEGSKSKIDNKGEIQFGKSSSISKRSIEIPMKALIAEEISQELARGMEPKNRAPSVVARLMGLEALPGDKKSEQNIHRGYVENTVQKVSSDRLQQGKVAANNPPGGTKRATRSVSDLSSSRRFNWEEHAPSFEVLSSHKRSHERSSREVFTPWRNLKLEDHTRMQALEDLDSQLAAKQLLIKKKLSEAKLGLLSKSNGPQEKLYESKEFMDAIDFLQANKDFFARFLEEPDSLFAKHLRNSEGISTPGNLMEHSKRRGNGTLESSGKSQHHWADESPDLRAKHFAILDTDLRRGDGKLIGGGTMLQSFSAKPQHKHSKRAEYQESRGADCHQTPTRIVVLKPGPGKVRSLMTMSQNSPRSPQELFDAMDVIKENTVDVLQQLKDKLQQEDARGESRKARHFVNEHSKSLRDPREIAREIARQVRENAIRDLRAYSKSSTREIATGGKAHPSKIVKQSSIMYDSKKGNKVIIGRDCDDADSSSNFERQNSVFERNSPAKEEPRRSSDQLYAERYDGWLPEAENGTSERCGRGEHSHFFESVTESQKQRMLAADEDIDADSCTDSVCESETNGYARSEGRAEYATSITLLRSRSVPTSSSSLDRGLEETQSKDQAKLGNGPHVLKTVDTSRTSDASTRQLDPLRQSIFSRKGPGLKGSVFKSKLKIKHVDELHVPSLVHPAQKSFEATSYENEKVQHQIDDSGPILDSDSSASSLDNSLMLEAAVVAGGLDETRSAVESPSSGNVEVSKTEDTKAESDCLHLHIDKVPESSLLSPLESPSKAINLADEGPITAADSEGSKNLSEQPSPISVLDARFSEEPENRMDFTEISSGLQELRIRLQLLKFVDQDSVSIQENDQEGGVIPTDDKQCELQPRLLVLETAGALNSSSCLENPDVPTKGIHCPQGMERELTYVKELLVASGLITDNAFILTRWHAPSQPLARCIFETVENSYVACQDSNADGKEDSGELNSHTRHLLFDCVNEVLLEVLGPQVNCRSWWKPAQNNTATLEMRGGKDLLGQIWAGVCQLFGSQLEVQDTLGSLVAKDLATKDRWQDLTANMDVVVLEVERAVFTDLLLEVLMVY